MAKKKSEKRRGPGRPFQPGCPGGPGRPKGIPNVITSDVREMVRNALNAAGGEEYLQRQADENPKAFLALVGRIVPTNIELPKEPIVIRWAGELPKRDG